jgi:hypothetical protein
MARMLLIMACMGNKKFYKRYFEDAKHKLQVEGTLENHAHHLNSTCFACGSSRLKFDFEVNHPERTSIFLHCQECNNREQLTSNDRNDRSRRRDTTKNLAQS